MEIEKYLPAGTIVMLKEGNKRLMIIGFASKLDKENSKIYDYTGCIFPEGVLSSNQSILFDHDQIDKIFFIGLADEEQKNFNLRLKEYMNNQNKN